MRENAKFAEAQELLGTVLAARGELTQAIEHYRDALRLRPEYARAHIHLGEVSAESGAVTAARPYLRKAAESADPSAREQAQRELDKLQ